MIKLIASDLDGTLVPEATQDVNPELFDTIRELNDKGIIFVAASGREFDTMKTIVDPIGDIIYCISNNGGRITKFMRENIAMYSLEWELAKRAIAEVKKDDRVDFVSANTADGTYTDSCNEEVLDWLINGYGLNAIRVDDMLEKPMNILKISVLTKCDASEVVEYYQEKFGKECHVTVAGDKWIDFTHSLADKGIALKNLIESLGIKPEETWAFGDNNNDISMLKVAGVGFASPIARDEVKAAADVCLDGSIWDAVINQMKTLIGE